MRYIRKTLNYEAEMPSVITLGKFDGVHRGHMRLINRILEIGKKDDLETVIFTFDVSPQVSLNQKKPQMLLTNEERRKRLHRQGIHTLIECPFVPEIRDMEAEDFIRKILVKNLQVKALVVGPDFHFGHGRRGTPEMLDRMGKEYGFTVEVLDKVMDGDREISSTYIREELSKGNMEKVNELLGYPYTLTGEVIHGHQLGRTIGVPTINQIPGEGKLLPPRGVYASRTRIAGKEFHGITNIGIKPTVLEKFVGVETYLFDCDMDLYGEKAKVELYHYQRPERKFESVDALKMQLQKDEKRGKEYFISK